MSDLISRKDAIELLKNDMEHNELPYDDEYNIGIDHAMCLLACVPTADLVRCGECRHWNYVCEDEMFGMKYGECRFYKWLDGCNQGKEMLSTDFCSYGERNE